MEDTVPRLATKTTGTARRSARDAVVARTPEQIRALREDWLFLRRRYGTSTPNAAPDFFVRVYRVLGDHITPHVAVFRDGELPYAMIVGRISRNVVNCRFGYVRVHSPRLWCLDIVYGGLITDGQPSSRRVVAEYLQSVLCNRTVELLRVHDLNVEHELTAELMRSLSSHATVVCERDVRWRLNLLDPATGKRILHHSSKTRSTLRRKDKKLVRAFGNAVDLRTVRDSCDVGEFIHVAGSITAKTYQAALTVGVRETQRWRTILDALAGEGCLRGFVLRGKGEPIAYLVGAVFCKQFTLLATGFVPVHRNVSPGSVLMWRVLDALASEGIVTVDFGSGDVAYKRLLGTDMQEEVTLNLYGRGWRPVIAGQQQRAVMLISRFAMRVAGSLGVVGKVKKKWRRWLEPPS